MQCTTKFFSTIQTYLDFKDNDFEENYKHNMIEKVGNFLLEPIDIVFKKFNDSNSIIVKTGLVVAGLFAGILGILGAFLKELGELANSNAHLRSEAINIIKETSTMRMKLNKCVNKLNNTFGYQIPRWHQTPKEKLDSLFEERILINKEKASRYDVNFIKESPILNFNPVANVNNMIHNMMSKESQQNQQNLQIKIKQIYTQWLGTWETIHRKLETNEDISAEQNSLLNLVSRDYEVSERTKEYLHGIEAIAKTERAIAGLETRYNSIIVKM